MRYHQLHELVIQAQRITTALRTELREMERQDGTYRRRPIQRIRPVDARRITDTPLPKTEPATSDQTTESE